MACWHKAYRYRIYPTKEQAILLAKTFGCCRKVYNLMLSDKIDYYEKHGKTLYPTPARYKKDYPYLKEVDSLALANEQLHLQAAYKNFFEGNADFPKFKSKHKDRNSYTTNLVVSKSKKTGKESHNIEVFDGSIKLPKVGIIKATIHRTAPEGYKLKSVTISQEKDGSYYASVLYKYTPEVDYAVSLDVMTHVGLDYKSDGLFVASDGTYGDIPHFYRESEARLRRAQHKLSHMIESHIVRYEERDGERYPVYDRPLSEYKNVQEQRKAVAKISRHVANQRKDFLHKLSAGMTNRYDLISVESLSMKAMSNKGFGNGKATMDNGYGMFVEMLTYKQQEKGHFLVKVDKWYPSSQLCHICGHRNKDLKNLQIREWTCPCCGTFHDRDENASINIDREGKRLFLTGTE